jgi:polyisoprenoid-binding protein YceI
MKLRSLSTALLALCLGSTSALATEWAFDDSHSKVLFTVKHLMITNVTGKFSGIKGTIMIDDKEIAKSKVDVTIDADSVNTDNGKRDDHLKGPDFFDVKKYPALKFVSKKIDKVSDGVLKVSGDMTIKDKTVPVTFDVEGPTPTIKDPWGNVKRGLSATTKISRKDFGITWNKALDGGGVVVGDDVKITLEVELNAKK